MTWIPSKKMSDYRSVLEKVLGLYMAAGFQVAQISCIRGFKPLIDEMNNEFGFYPNMPLHKSMYQRQNITTGLSKSMFVLHIICTLQDVTLQSVESPG